MCLARGASRFTVGFASASKSSLAPRVRYAHHALDVAHAGVLQQNVELLLAALTPEPQRLERDVHADLIPVPEAIDEGLLRVIDADRYAVELMRLDAVVEGRP